MVVRITSPHSIKRVLNYNEQKCIKEQAECIHAEGYLLDHSKMNFYEKLERLQELIGRNVRSKKSNTLHISLNFDPSEKFGKEKLITIAQNYMEKIGFGMQPYLVYQHHDAGHPHIHIVTTNIQVDGKRIDTYNIGRNQSEKARKEIELSFGLVRAEVKKQPLAQGLKPIDAQRIHYGKSETRRSISTVLDRVLIHFKYTSLTELNTILKQYNVIADKGIEKGRIHKYGGLLYGLLDGNGNKIGIPIKASLFHNKPTLKFLEERFRINEKSRHPDKKKLKAAIDWALSKSSRTLEGLIQSLRKENIQAILRQNKGGLIYGITFIDYRTKSVFNGSDVGKQYSIAGINQQLGKSGSQSLIHSGEKSSQTSVVQQQMPESKITGSKDDLLKELMEHDKNINRVAGDLLKKKKKRNKNL